MTVEFTHPVTHAMTAVDVKEIAAVTDEGQVLGGTNYCALTLKSGARFDVAGLYSDVTNRLGIGWSQ